MTANGHRPRHHRTALGLASALGVVLLAALSATGALDVLRAGHDVALGGPLPMHAQPSSPSLANELPGAAPEGGEPQPAILTVPAGPRVTVPILYYHFIRAIPPTPDLLGFRLSISPALFAEQMALLHVEGAHTITLATLMDALQHRTPLPVHPVVLTFDDGFADFATSAQPILAQYGFVATDFVVSGFINRPQYMTAAQVLEMQEDGMVIGSHTVHHVDLVGVAPARARAEIVDGKHALEQLLGHPVLDFAYPYGGFNAAVVLMVQGAGFRDAVTTMYGRVQALNGRFELRRIELGGVPTLILFAHDAGLPAPSVGQFAQIAFLVREPARPNSA